MPSDEFDVLDDCIWLGSRQVARLNPTLYASERGYVIDCLTSTPIHYVKDKLGETVEADDFLNAFDVIKRMLAAKAKAGLVSMSDVNHVVDEIKDDFLLE